jgi:hypothetical protein
VATITIGGVEFELDDAADFANRLQLASAGTSRAGLSPAHALAIEIDQAVNAGGGGGGDVEIPDEARPIAFAVLDEWYGTAPESARQLRRLLGH